MDRTGKEKLKPSIFRKRKFLFLFFTFLKILQNKLSSKKSKVVKEILIYPEVKDVEQLADLLNRLVWGIPSSDVKIFVTVNSELISTKIESLTPPAIQRNYLDKKQISNIRLINKDQALQKLNADAIFVLNYKFLLKWSFFKRIGKIEIIDKNFFSVVEPNVWRGFFINTLHPEEKKEIRDLSMANFKRMKSEILSDTAFCFTSGPSFDRYKEFEYGENDFKIICNSIVKNRAFLNHITKPDLLVFADPVFHFSPCEYSALFRDQAIEVIKDYKCFFMVPEYTLPLLLKHYPEIRNFAIGMPTEKKSAMHFPSVDKFWVKSSDNILTLLMLPIASSMCENIYVIGSDGRKKTEKYFWKHSSSVQYDSLMQTVFDTHPSFFRDRDYADYFDQHCEFLKKLIEHGEGKGKKYHSLTPSYIPALSNRWVQN